MGSSIIDTLRGLDYVTISRRKLRLFGCACARANWAHLSEHGRQALRLVEEHAEGETSSWQWHPADSAWKAVKDGQEKHGAMVGVLPEGHQLYDEVSGPPDVNVAYAVLNLHWDDANVRKSVENVACRVRDDDLAAALLREVFGSSGLVWPPKQMIWTLPDPPLFDDGQEGYPWITPEGRAIARQAYDERDFALLGILADALEDAGCRWDALLEHLRGPGWPHCLGCWALDVVLGKE